MNKKKSFIIGGLVVASTLGVKKLKDIIKVKMIKRDNTKYFDYVTLNSDLKKYNLLTKIENKQFKEELAEDKLIDKILKDKKTCNSEKAEELMLLLKLNDIYYDSKDQILVELINNLRYDDKDEHDKDEHDKDEHDKDDSVKDESVKDDEKEK